MRLVRVGEHRHLVAALRTGVDDRERAALGRDDNNPGLALGVALGAAVAVNCGPEALRDTLALHERNVEALRKEIGNLR